MNEATLNQIIQIAAEAAVELFVKKGIEATPELVNAWVNDNWAMLSKGIIKGVEDAAA
jgi:hypothetical protein